MNIIRTIGLALVLFATVEPASAIESLGYETVEEFNDVEIRQYEAHLLASVRVRGGFKNASYNAFRPLFNFISGDNTEATEIAMTAPVLQPRQRRKRLGRVLCHAPQFRSFNPARAYFRHC